MKQIRILLGNEEDRISKFIAQAMDKKSKIRSMNRDAKNIKRSEMFKQEEDQREKLFENERQKRQQMEKEALKKALDRMIDGSNGAIGDELEEILDYIYWERMMEEMRWINELK